MRYIRYISRDVARFERSQITREISRNDSRHLAHLYDLRLYGILSL